MKRNHEKIIIIYCICLTGLAICLEAMRDLEFHQRSSWNNGRGNQIKWNKILKIFLSLTHKKQLWQIFCFLRFSLAFVFGGNKMKPLKFIFPCVAGWLVLNTIWWMADRDGWEFFSQLFITGMLFVLIFSYFPFIFQLKCYEIQNVLSLKLVK